MAIGAGKVVLVLFSIVLMQAADCKKNLPEPCMNLAFYYHDILYDGSNSHNATSAKVAAAANTANFSNNFGDMVVFDDLLMMGKSMKSAQVGRAQGFYFYDSPYAPGAWIALTFVLYSTEHKGTLTMARENDPIVDKYRYFSIVGGTGDFLMARGLAIVSADQNRFEG